MFSIPQAACGMAICILSALLAIVGGGLGYLWLKAERRLQASQELLRDAEKATPQFSSEVQSILQIIREYLHETHGYAGRLSEINETLNDDPPPEKLRLVIETLIDENKQLLGLSENLQDRLEQSQKTIEKLTGALDEARAEGQRDALTRLYCRKHFEEAFPKLIALAKTEQKELCLILIDVDNFKAINDSYGHLAGDEVIKSIGAVIQQSIRKDDLAIRYGGDEFAVILPRTAIDDARSIAERIQALLAIKIWRFDTGAPPRGSITTSIGISALSWRDSPEAVFKRADAFLYKAKERGKNRVSAA
jgi:diguanylate cyclase